MTAALVPARNTLRIYLLEAKYEFLSVLRTPGFALPSLMFPVMFYLFFGVIFGGGAGRVGQATYLLATYGTFGIMGPALFGFGAGMASERSQGWLLLKRVSPMPTMAYFFGKMVMCLLFAVIIEILLLLMGVLFAKVAISPWQMLRLCLILSAGTLPFCALGLAIGSHVTGRSAPAVVNLIYLPMAFLSGLWIPITAFPDILQSLAKLMPAYHLSQLALAVVDMDVGGHPAWHVLVLALEAALFLLLARRGFKKG